MKVQLKDREISIRWQHTHRNHPNLQDDLISHDLIRKKFNGKTVCFIEEGQRDQRKILSQGETYCSRKDQFKKEDGRRASLARALTYLDRDQRQLVWDAYWAR